jgi:hypothetical protein
MIRQGSNFGDAFLSQKKGRLSSDLRSSSKSQSEAPAQKEPLSSASVAADSVLYAMHCAYELCNVQTEKFSVHVAMSCGEMCFGILGGVENRWECLISGACLHELSDCLDDAPSKQAVISAGCAKIVLQEALQTGAIGTPIAHAVTTDIGMYDFELIPLSSGNHRIKHVRCMDGFADQLSLQSKGLVPSPELRSAKRTFATNKLLKQFVPLPIADAIERDEELQFIAEIREVTTMFMKVSVANHPDRKLIHFTHISRSCSL